MQVLNVDLKAPSKMPSALVTMVTKRSPAPSCRSSGARREAGRDPRRRRLRSGGGQRLPAQDGRGGDGFYEQVNGLIERYFEMFGEEEDEDEDEGEDDSQDDD